MPGRIEEKLSRIDSLIKEEKYGESLEELELLESKIDSDGQPLLAGRFYHLSARTSYNLGKYKKAITSGEIALGLLKHTAENRLIADTQHILGRVFLSLGNLKSAESHLRDAITTYKRIEDKKQVIRSQNIVARICFQKSDFVKAKEVLEDALESSMQIGDAKLTAVLGGNLGRVYILLGDWDKVEDHLLASLQYCEKRGTTELTVCRDLLALGCFRSLRRDFDKARDYYARALKLLEKNDWVREQAIYHEYQGELAFNQGRIADAESHYKKIIGIIEKTAPEGDMINQTYRLLAELQFKKGEYDEASSSCERSLEVSLSLGDILEEGAVYRIMGQIYAAQGRSAKSRRYFNRSISTLQAISARFELAKSYLGAGKAEAFDYYERLGYLVDAAREFEGLKVEYYVAQVNLSIASLFLDTEEWDRVSHFLKRAESLFAEAKDKEGLAEVDLMRQKVQKKRADKLPPISREEKSPNLQVITQNEQMLDLLERIHQIKDEDCNILLEGETGTGKDLLAEYIHYTSKRKGKKLVQVTCSEFTGELLPNELFGHRKGAYSWADRDQPGVLEEADGGTVYLDHITETAPNTQVRLLRVTEKKEITRLGDAKPRKVNVRIIASTNKDIQSAMKNLSFRRDLFYRLKTIRTKIPPLRDRKDDIPLLIRHFLRRVGADEELIHSIGNGGGLTKLLAYKWPGNVRELENLVTSMYAESGGDKHRFAQLLKNFRRDLPEEEENIPLNDQLKEFEKKKIEDALKEAKGVQTKAAARLGIHESVLRSKIKRLGMRNKHNNT